MNYKRIYHAIISNALQQNRVKNKGIYYETHHITPDFMYKKRNRKGPAGHLEGNSDDKSNIVLLTGREHLLCHILYYKMMKGTHYEYPAATSIGFFIRTVNGINDDKSYHPRDVENLYSYTKKYAIYKKIANDAMSKIMKGMVIVKDSKTDIIFGRVSTTDPRYLSGELVQKDVGNKRPNCGRNQSGINNANYKYVDLDKLLDDTCDYVYSYGNTHWSTKEITKHLVSLGYIVTYAKKYGGIAKFKELLNVKYNEKYGDDIVFKKDSKIYKEQQQYYNIYDDTYRYKVKPKDIDDILRKYPNMKRGRDISKKYKGKINELSEFKF